MSEHQDAYESVDWDNAACRGLGISGFFPERGGRLRREVTRIQMVCKSCRIADECREYGRRWESFGVWGGVLADKSLIYRLYGHMPWFRAVVPRVCFSCGRGILPGQDYRQDPKDERRSYCKECVT